MIVQLSILLSSALSAFTVHTHIHTYSETFVVTLRRLTIAGCSSKGSGACFVKKKLTITFLNMTAFQQPDYQVFTVLL